MERARDRECRGNNSDTDSEKKQHLKSNNSKSSPKLADTEPTTATSDFDSMSTTSASYVVSHSDMESLSLNDHQLDLLMKKSVALLARRHLQNITQQLFKYPILTSRLSLVLALLPPAEELVASQFNHRSLIPLVVCAWTKQTQTIKD